jgi:hypothetical protein
LTVRNPKAPGLKPHKANWQQGPQVTSHSISFQGGTWLLTQALEDALGTIVVNRTGLSDYYDVNLEWDSTPDSLKRALSEQLGMDLVPSSDPVAVRMVILEKAKPASPVPDEMVEVADIQPDGTTRLQVTIKQTNRADETISKDYVSGMGSDGMIIDSVRDTSGQPMPYFLQQDSFENTMIVTLNQPVPADAQFTYTVAMTLTNLIQPGNLDGEFVCQMNDCPDDECITHSVETYRLPPGAVLLSKGPAALQEAMNAGRTELKIERTVLAGHTRELSFRYRLPTKVN